jgi:hypothetical protein
MYLCVCRNYALLNKGSSAEYIYKSSNAQVFKMRCYQQRYGPSDSHNNLELCLTTASIYKAMVYTYRLMNLYYSKYIQGYDIHL